MKKVCILAIFICFMGVSGAFAGQFGPAEAQVNPGQFSLGFGVFRYSDKWDFQEFTTDADQTQFFVQADIGLFSGTEAYLRIGEADATVKDALGGQKFSGDTKPFGTIGLKGLFHRGQVLDVGGFIEGSYFQDYSDQTAAAKLSLDKSYSINAGLTFQKEVEGALLYAGPFFHYRKGDFTYTDATDSSNSFFDSYEEDNNIGGFLGIQWTALNSIVIDAETQLRSNLSFGGAISFVF